MAAAAHAVLMGYNVNYYTLELGEDYVGKRFDCYFTGHGIEEVNKHRGEVEKIVGKLKGKLIVKEYPPKGASINTIKSHIPGLNGQDGIYHLIVLYARNLKQIFHFTQF